MTGVGVGSQAGWLRGPKCLRAGVVLLVGQARGQIVTKPITLLVFRLVPHMAGCRTTVVLGLMSACYSVGLGLRGAQG